jgi:hypothetical protein
MAGTGRVGRLVATQHVVGERKEHGCCTGCAPLGDGVPAVQANSSQFEHRSANFELHRITRSPWLLAPLPMDQ